MIPISLRKKPNFLLKRSITELYSEFAPDAPFPKIYADVLGKKLDKKYFEVLILMLFNPSVLELNVVDNNS